jgi:hypothetical protein
MGELKPFAYLTNDQGIDESSGIFFIEPSAADYIQNMHVDLTGSYSAHLQGWSALTSTLEGGARIDGLGQYRDDNGNDYLLTAVNGKLKSILPGLGTDLGNIASDLTAGAKIDFANFKGTLYIASNTIAPKKWSGTGNTSPAGGLPIINGIETYLNPSIVEVYNNRLVYANFQGGNKYPSHLAVSDDLSPESFTLTNLNATSAAIRQISPGDGQAIVAMKSLYISATNETVLVIFKDRSIHVLEGDTPTTFENHLINDTVGCLNNQCVVQVGNDLIFMDANTITSLSTANQSGTIQANNIGSYRIQKTLKRLNWSQRQEAWAQHLPSRREIWFGIPTGSSTQVDTILVYRYTTSPSDGGQWIIRKGSNVCCPLLFNTSFLCGTYTGQLVSWFNNTGYGNQEIDWVYKYPFYHFGTPHQNKRIVELYGWFLLNAAQTLTITTEWRGGGGRYNRSITKTVGIGQGGALFGSTTPPAAVFGTDRFGDVPLAKVRIPVYGNGEQFRLSVQGSSSTTGPVFLGFTGLIETLAPSRSYK